MCAEELGMSLNTRVRVVGNSVVVLASLKFGDFPILYQDYVNENIDTLPLERHGHSLMRSSSIGTRNACNFVERVTRWGGRTGGRVKGNLFKHNSNQRIATAVRQAARHLKNNNIPQAIQTLIALKGLHVSYGSKILRMLAPKKVVVYDQYIALFSGHLMYRNKANDVRKFLDFLADCKTVLPSLQSRNINPVRGSNWILADVEACLYYPIYNRINKIREAQLS